MLKISLYRIRNLLKPNLTFTAKRRLQRIAVISLVALLALILVWSCWVIWIGRYVVYSREGATIDMSVPLYLTGGQEARPPAADETIPIYINEGSDAITMNTELTKINGFFIDTDTLSEDLTTAMDTIATLPSGTAVMVELKNKWGTFFYSSDLADATVSTKLDVAGVDKLIQELNSKNLYSIAMVPAFRERYYCLNHSAAGLEVTRRTHLWEDGDKCYWLDPTDNSALNWVMSVVEELKSLGFDEVVFTEFRMPDTDGIYFSGDRDGAIKSAAAKIVDKCATEGFAISFMTDDPSFPLPNTSRCRLYVSNVSAKDVGAAVAKLQVPDPKVNVVFMANSNDTRYDEYSSLRSIVTVSGND